MKFPSILRAWPRKLLVATSFFFFASFAFPAEILTNDGQVFDGSILEEQTDYILMELKGGVQVRIEKAQIANIHREDLPKDDLKREYPVAGVTGGFPGEANLVLGYYLRDVGFKLAGGFLNGGGAQLDLSKKIIETQDWLANISFVGGYTNVQTYGTNWWYDGLGFDVNWRGFTAELNLTNGQSNSSKPTLGVLLQAGYVFRFID